MEYLVAEHVGVNGMTRWLNDYANEGWRLFTVTVCEAGEFPEPSFSLTRTVFVCFFERKKGTE